MSKPIFIIRFPIKQLMPFNVRNELAGKMQDYHILFIPNENDEIEFECYNSEKANEIDFEFLQKRVIELTKLALP